MLLIGLTGSIATGKSTVSTLLSSPPYNLPIIDADLLAREVVLPGTPGYDAIVSHFSSTTPDLLLPADEDGNQALNRPALGRRVFGSSKERLADRKVLNGIIHPAVRRAMWNSVLYYYVRGHWAVVLDVPLLFESGLDVFCGVVVVVGIKDVSVQLSRLLKRDKDVGGTMTEQEARERIESQGDVVGKVQRVEVRGKGWGEVIWNDKGKDELEKEVKRVMDRIQGGSPSWWAWLELLVPPLAGTMGVYAMWRGMKAKRDYEEKVKAEQAKL